MGSQKSSITYNQQPNATPCIGLQLEETKTLTRRPSSGHTIYHMAKLTLCLFAVFLIFSRVRETWREIMAYSHVYNVYMSVFIHTNPYSRIPYMYILYVVGRLPQCICIFFTFGDFLRLNFQYVI